MKVYLHHFSAKWRLCFVPKKLPNLKSDQIELSEFEIKTKFLSLIDNPQIYELNGVLSMAEDEVDVYLRQLSNKKKTFFFQQKLINLHKLSINERYSLIFACIFLFLIGPFNRFIAIGCFRSSIL